MTKPLPRFRPHYQHVNYVEKSDANVKKTPDVEKPKNWKDNFLQKFKDSGFNGQDLTKAILIHEILGIIMLGITWTFCYYVQITKIPVLQGPLEKMASLMPNFVKNNELITSRVGVAYFESSCLRKIIRPFTLPTKFLVTIKIVQMLKTNSQAKTINSLSSQPISDPTHLKQASYILNTMTNAKKDDLCI
jgi:hypothetical protein